jgi:hypothetical protein
LGDVGRIVPLRNLLLELDEFGLVGLPIPFGLSQRTAGAEIAVHRGGEDDEQ